MSPEDAKTLHYREEVHVVGDGWPACSSPRSNTWRVNGAVQTWKRDPSRLRVPIKFGLRGYDAITEHNAHMFHRASECPDLQ